jgi:hypothetical protein
MIDIRRHRLACAGTPASRSPHLASDLPAQPGVPELPRHVAHSRQLCARTRLAAMDHGSMSFTEVHVIYHVEKSTITNIYLIIFIWNINP